MKFIYITDPLGAEGNTTENLLKEVAGQGSCQKTAETRAALEIDGALEEIGKIKSIIGRLIAEILRRFEELEQRAKSAEDALEKAREAIRKQSEHGISTNDAFNLI